MDALKDLVAKAEVTCQAMERLKDAAISLYIYGDRVHLHLQPWAFVEVASDVLVMQLKKNLPYSYHARGLYVGREVSTCLTEGEAAHFYPEQYAALQVSA